MDPGFLLHYLSGYISQLPLYAVYIAGIVIASTRLRQHRIVCIRVIVACAVLLGSSLILTPVGMWLPRFLIDDLGIGPLGYILTGFGLVRGLINAAAFGLLLMAAFGDRERRMPILEVDSSRDFGPKTGTGIREARSQL